LDAIDFFVETRVISVRVLEMLLLLRN
jgi:hypothetical protein